MNPVHAFAIAGALAATPTPAIFSQAFTDRARVLQQRISENASARRLAPGEQPMLQAQLDAARAAYACHDPQSGAMLDVIDRELALVDYTLSRAENGRTLAVNVGDTVTIAMRDENGYDVKLDGQALVRAPGVMFMRGVQGVYTASRAGVYPVTLTPLGGSVSPVSFTVVILPKP